MQGDQIALHTVIAYDTARERDHLRYMAHQSERQAKQRDYYRTHSDYYKRKAREWEQKQREMI